MKTWLALVFVLVVAACGSDDDTAADVDTKQDVPPDTKRDVAPDVDEGTRCCPLGNCPVDQSCIQGACLPSLQAHECYFDGACEPGQVCVDVVRCECGQTDCTPRAGSCAYPQGCCNTPAECSGDQVCHEGVCRVPPGGGACWTAAECDTGQSCEGGDSCPCDATGCDAAPGVCGLSGVCCLTDAECGADGVCRGGSCVEAPTGGACYVDGDCGAGGESCLGASLCQCGNECPLPTTPGVCGAAAGACCVDDTGCGAGEICVDGKACAPAPADNRCYVDDHCGLGRVCEGASVCDCDDASCTESLAGQCLTPVLKCTNDANCPVAMRCAMPDTYFCPGGPDPSEGVCVPQIDDGCWSSTECNGLQRCAPEIVCIDPAGCEAPNAPGACRAKVMLRDCCSSHRECESGLQCRNQNTSMTCPPDVSAVCLSTPDFGERCWNIDDCPEGLVCNRVWICGCNGKCYRNHEGVCETPVYCQANIDCGADRVCAKDPECILSPCTTTSTCNPGGQCQLKIEGFCWSHDECGAGNYCEGLRICPPEEDCPIPDAPGVCATRAGLGECCTSFKGCEPGLRCASVANQSGCSVDFTSVCVPAITLGIECYANDDCSQGQECSGEVVCPCGVETCVSEPLPGTCTATVP